MSPRSTSSLTEIEWRGQTFRLRRSYRDWEQYKKASKQLAREELERVMNLMTAVSVPRSFRNLSEWARGMPEIEFPGYGHSSNGKIWDDSGTRYQMSEYTIPDSGKARAILYKVNPDGTLTLVMDQVIEEHENDRNPFALMNGKVVVEGKALRHYLDGVCYREATLNELGPTEA